MMIKPIIPQNIILTPLVVSNNLNLHNSINEDLVLLEDGTHTVASEYVDYFNYNGNGSPPENSDCSIALEQQTGDLIIFRAAISQSGRFDASNDPTNLDGTYKRLVYTQIYNSFYNPYKNPLELFGLNNIDIPLSKTIRTVNDSFLTMNVPPSIFGNTIVPSSISITNLPLDDNMTINDDGYGNLIVGNDLFFRIQELRNFGNIFFSGSVSTNCSGN